MDGVAPRAQDNLATFDDDRCASVQWFEDGLRLPGSRSLGLVAILVEMLVEVAFAIE